MSPSPPRTLLHVLNSDTGRKQGGFIRDELAKRGIQCAVAPTLGKDGSMMAAVDNTAYLDDGRLQAVLISCGQSEMYGVADEIFDEALSVNERGARLSRFFPDNREIGHRIQFWNAAKQSNRFLIVLHGDRRDGRYLPLALRDKPTFFAGKPEDMDRLARTIAEFKTDTVKDWNWTPPLAAGSAAAAAGPPTEDELAALDKLLNQPGDDPTAYVQFLTHAAATYERAGRLHRAVEAITTALDVSTRERKEHAIGTLSIRLASLRLSTGDLSGAVEQAHRAVDVADRLGEAGIRATALRVLGNAHAALNDWASALSCYERALDAAARAQDVQSQWVTLVAIGDTQRRMGRMSQARGAYQDALMIVQSLRDPAALKSVRDRLTEVSGEAIAPASDSLPISVLSSFSLTPGAQAVLDRAKAMTPPGGRWATLSALAFLFAFKELGREGERVENTLHFVHRYLDREAGPAYGTLYRTTVKAWSDDSPADIAVTQPPGSWVQTITPNVERLFDRARRIVQSVRKSPKSAADPGLEEELAYVTDIYPRHLFAALLTYEPAPGTPNNVIEKLNGMRIDVAALRNAFFEVVTANTPEESTDAWRQVLAIAPSSQRPNDELRPADQSAPPPGLIPLSTLDAHRLTSNTRKILDKAIQLAVDLGHRGPPPLTASLLLFAILELGGRPADGVASAQFIRGYVQGNDPDRYRRVYGKFMERWDAHEEDPLPPAGQRIEFMRPDAAAVFLTAADLAAKTIPSRAASGPAPEVHARHLVGAILAPNPASDAEIDEILADLGASRSELARRLVDYLRETHVGDDFAAWEAGLGLTRPPTEEKEPDQPAPPLPGLDQFRFSKAGATVLASARALAATLNTPPAAPAPRDLTSIAILFALAQLGAKPGADPDARMIARAFAASSDLFMGALHGSFIASHRAVQPDPTLDLAQVTGLSPDAVALLQEAQRIARLTSHARVAGVDSSEIAPKHLTAALATSALASPPPPHRAVLDSMRINPRDIGLYLGVAARNWTSPRLLDPDNRAGWKTVLAPLTNVRDLLPDVYQISFNADRNDTDKLNLTHEIDAFAYLIASTTMQPPLSIGLFGEWGSGKSFFMTLLRKRIEELARDARVEEASIRATIADEEARDAALEGIKLHRHICQIEFNAWHYVEGNIWASLVEHIFDNLKLASLDKDAQKADADKRKAEIFDKLKIAESFKNSLLDQQKQLEGVKAEAEDRLKEVKKQQVERSGLLGQARNKDAWASMIWDGTDLTPHARALFKKIGLSDEVLNSPKELYSALADVRASTGSIRAVITRILGRSTSEPVFWLIVAAILIVPAGLGLLVTRLLAQFDTEIKAVVGGLTQLAAMLGTAAAWLRSRAKTVDDAAKEAEPVLKALQEQHDKAEAARQSQITSHEQALDRINTQYAEVCKRVEDANKGISELQAQIQQMETKPDANRILAKFVEDRAASTDYRRHLGITSLIRDDFEQLEQLISSARTTPPVENQSLPIDRIVLYIDDLDRCPPDKVVTVLEAIHLILAFELFVVVVGVDARWVSRSLKSKYGPLLSGPSRRRKGDSQDPAEAPQEAPADPRTREPNSAAAVPEDYLEKIFHVPFRLRTLQPTDAAQLIEHLTEIKPSASRDKKSRAKTQTPPPPTTTAAPPVPADPSAQTPSTTGSTPSTQTQPPRPLVEPKGSQTVRPADATSTTPAPAVIGAPPPEARTVDRQNVSPDPGRAPSPDSTPRTDRPAQGAPGPQQNPAPRSTPDPAQPPAAQQNPAPQAAGATSTTGSAGSSGVPPPTSTPATGAASAAGSGGATPAPTDTSVSLLNLTKGETDFMKSLAPIIGRSPRAVFRFVNCYRLHKAARPAISIPDFEAGPSDYVKVPDYEACMLVLALVIGAPEIAGPMLAALIRRTDPAKAELNDLIADWNNAPDIQREPEWKRRVKPFLDTYAKTKDQPCPIQPFRSAAAAVSRYSFRTGMMEDIDTLLSTSLDK